MLILGAMLRQRRNKRGFTLIELMTVVAVVGILSMIAIPTYYNDTYRAHRVEAALYLENINIAQNSTYAHTDVFASTFSQMLEFDPNITKLSPSVAKGKRYTYTITQPWGPRSWLCVASADLDGDSWNDLLIAYDQVQ